MQGVHAARVIDQGKAKVVRDGKTCISLGSIHSHEDGDRSVLVRAAKAKGKKANMFCAQRAGETWILAVRVTDGSTELRIDVFQLTCATAQGFPFERDSKPRLLLSSGSSSSSTLVLVLR